MDRSFDFVPEKTLARLRREAEREEAEELALRKSFMQGLTPTAPALEVEHITVRSEPAEIQRMLTSVSSPSDRLNC